ncbi:MAG: hypothetical protein JNG88_15445 [Phycisphaerales bacterium]|nr:hypothetical protein [Phycisphaerales bacterium]
MRALKRILTLSQGAALVVLFSCLPTDPPGGPDENGLIDFDEAVIELSAGGERELVVRGYVPTPCHSVSLQPVTYIMQPDYWNIQVLADAGTDPCAQLLTPYEARLVLDHSVGTRGIEVIGRNKSRRMDVP